LGVKSYGFAAIPKRTERGVQGLGVNLKRRPTSTSPLCTRTRLSGSSCCSRSRFAAGNISPEQPSRRVNHTSEDIFVRDARSIAAFGNCF